MSTSRPTVRVSAIPRPDAPSALQAAQWAFALETDPGEPIDAHLDFLDLDRFHGGYVPGPDGTERLAGVYATLSADCPLPGGTIVPSANLTWVGVHPRDRRRGVLTAMIRHHLDDVRTHRGEPFSILFSAEPAIYGRFGYGLASTIAFLKIPRGAALRDVAGADELVVDIEYADADRHAEPLARCFEAAAAGRPGCAIRPTPGTRRYALYDPPLNRRGAETLRVLTVTAPGGDLRGYALFRRSRRHDPESPVTVEVTEAVARDAAATHAIWSRLLDLDLSSHVLTPGLPPDDALLHLLVDARAAHPRLSDGLWLRLADLPAALTARRYATGVDVTLEVTDALLPSNAGRWHLVGTTDGATCTRTDAEPQLSLDVRELGSAYLGGVSLAALAAAGLVTAHDPTALATASVAFSSPVAPWSAWSF